ncbi:MAG: thiolase family protein [Clostridiales Family XIII bacterium]|nr:thiolase family protein [Clostridia bacterium]MDY3010506.1 thiolase family protein [Clostridiales Family XIII bacterium]
MKPCVITGAARTAVGAYLGSLKTVEAQDLCAAAITAAAKRSDIELGDLDQVIMGDVYGYTPNVSRCAALVAGVPEEVPAYVVDRQCASSLQAVVSACYEIAAGEADIVMAGGVEVMSRLPFYLDPSARYKPFRLGDKPLFDTFNHGVTMVSSKKYPGLNMGLTAENVADKYGITREEMDAFSVDSQRKMAAAKAAGKFKKEIVPFEVQDRKGNFIVDEDEHNTPNTTMESLAKLKPAFKRDGGLVTAGNSSGMNDGASAVVVMSEEKAEELGKKPLVKIISMSATGCDPRIMGIGPVSAVKKALKKANLTLEDMDLVELNEAFAAQSLGCLKELGIGMDTDFYKERVNVNGGAIAHGHALANSGTRILTTLIYEMKRRDARYGLATLCIGGGQGMAMIVENCK